jgi:hypothetical protein
MVVPEVCVAVTHTGVAETVVDVGAAAMPEPMLAETAGSTSTSAPMPTSMSMSMSMSTSSSSEWCASPRCDECEEDQNPLLVSEAAVQRYSARLCRDGVERGPSAVSGDHCSASRATSTPRASSTSTSSAKKTMKGGSGRHTPDTLTCERGGASVDMSTASSSSSASCDDDCPAARVESHTPLVHAERDVDSNPGDGGDVEEQWTVSRDYQAAVVTGIICVLVD